MDREGTGQRKHVHTDTELVLMIKHGNESAFDILMIRYLSLIHSKAAHYSARGLDEHDFQAL